MHHHEGGLAGIHLILGGARSGKTRYGEQLVNSAGGGTYIATGRAWDDEMAARIAQHRIDRGDHWHTIEAPLELCAALDDCRRIAPGRPVLIDCLTLWVTNLMMENRDIDADTDRLCALLQQIDIPVLLVSNEVGLGIVPENAMARQFRDHTGRLHQKIAAIAHRVTLVVAGIPLAVKQ